MSGRIMGRGRLPVRVSDRAQLGHGAVDVYGLPGVAADHDGLGGGTVLADDGNGLDVDAVTDAQSIACLRDADPLGDGPERAVERPGVGVVARLRDESLPARRVGPGLTEGLGTRRRRYEHSQE
jgi:hypothetical protein